MARVQKKSSQTAPPMDKLLKPAVGVAIAMLGYYVIKGSELFVVAHAAFDPFCRRIVVPYSSIVGLILQ